MKKTSYSLNYFRIFIKNGILYGKYKNGIYINVKEWAKDLKFFDFEKAAARFINHYVNAKFIFI